MNLKQSDLGALLDVVSVEFDDGKKVKPKFRK
jgi:hypothetical protein